MEKPPPFICPASRLNRFNLIDLTSYHLPTKSLQEWSFKDFKGQAIVGSHFDTNPLRQSRGGRWNNKPASQPAQQYRVHFIAPIPPTKYLLVAFGSGCCRCRYRTDVQLARVFGGNFYRLLSHTLPRIMNNEYYLLLRDLMLKINPLECPAQINLNHGYWKSPSSTVEKEKKKYIVRSHATLPS